MLAKRVVTLAPLAGIQLLLPAGTRNTRLRSSGSKLVSLPLES